MKNTEFKVKQSANETRYVLESGSGGATVAGNIATSETPIGKIQSRDMDEHHDWSDEDHEIQMAGSELHDIVSKAQALHQLIKRFSEQEGLEAWQQSKITKAADYLTSVYRALVHHVQGEGMLPKSAFAGSDQNELGVAGQWGNKGPKANKPAQQGDLVGGADESAMGETGKGLWHNINKKRKQGRSPNRPGEKGYPTKKAWDAAVNASKKESIQMNDEYSIKLEAMLGEKIPRNAPIDVYIKDFERSNALQFRGKSKEKRHEMAKAAFMAAQKPKKPKTKKK